MDSERSDSAVDIAAQALREIALQKNDGDFLGSEDDLVTLLKVSKPTLRQASARVAQEHLIRVRRGVGGGYFARTPGSLSVSRMAAVYLRSRNASYSEITLLVPMLYAELARLAATNRELHFVARLREFAERDETTIDPHDLNGFAQFMKHEREFVSFLADMAGNNVLQLMIEITGDFSSSAPRNNEAMLQNMNMAEYRKLRARVARAIANGDADIAELLTRRCTTVMCKWMGYGLKDQSFDVEQIRSA